MNCKSLRIILLAVAITALIVAEIECKYEPHWEKAKKKYGLSFGSSSEEAEAFSTYAKNMASIEEFNAKGTSSYRLGENQFTHLSAKQREGILSVPSKTLLGSRYNGNNNNNWYNWFWPGPVATTTTTTTTTPAPTNIPASVNWTYLFSPIKDQGNCGSCYAFAAAGLVEATYAKSHNNQTISLSEQELIDCTSSRNQNEGCNGGDVDICFKYLESTGEVPESTYPYTGSQGTCKSSTISGSSTKIFVNNYAQITSGSESALASYVATTGPATVYIYASNNFQSYSTGVFDDSACKSVSSNSINHAVIVVGYGTTSAGKQYWLVRNSWGTSWGMNGYIMMARNDNNNCFIASYPYGLTGVSTTAQGK